MLWTAQNRPDKVPIIENTLLAPGVYDPLELYDAACAGCHGKKGEGLSATPLTEYYLTEDFIRIVVLRGAPRSGMPSFSQQLTDEQLQILVRFVKALSDGDIVPPDSYALAPLVEQCGLPLAETGVEVALLPPESMCGMPIEPTTYQGN
jgi:mono/diheme cytochrome c family protein